MNNNNILTFVRQFADLILARASFCRKIAKRFFFSNPRRAGWLFKSFLQSGDISHIDPATEQEVHQFHQAIKNSIEKGHSKVVVILSSYPCLKPKHGGQLRCAAIQKEYANRGFTCIPLVIRDESSYMGECLPASEVIFPNNSPYRLYNDYFLPFCSDYCGGIFAVATPEVLEAVAKRILVEVDIIQVEHPFLFRFAQNLKDQIKEFKNAKLIYSAHNIEYKLKAEMLALAKIPNRIKEQVCNEIKAMEINAVKSADFVLAVSKEDQEYLERLAERAVILGKNSATINPVSAIKLNFWKKQLPVKYLIFVASAHLPNMVGFKSLIQQINKEIQIVVVGGVCNLFRDSLSKIIQKQVLLLGILNEEDLSAILALAHGVIIPITIGGGSNLKTAEALLTGKYVLGTTKSFRGFENYLSAPGVLIGDTPQEFQQAMVKIFDLPPSDFNSRCGEDLTWHYNLADFFKQVSV